MAITITQKNYPHIYHACELVFWDGPRGATLPKGKTPYAWILDDSVQDGIRPENVALADEALGALSPGDFQLFCFGEVDKMTLPTILWSLDLTLDAWFDEGSRWRPDE